MSSILPVGIGELLAGAVESIRLEFKASWNKEKTGPQIIETIAGFANDLQNLNGGYVLIGVAEESGVAMRPIQGLSPAQIDAAQKWLRGQCKRIVPEYTPLFSPEQIDGHHLLVIWAPASDARPHQAPNARRPKERSFFVRDGSETIEARGDIQRQLVEQTARIPFDDRVHLEALVEDLRDSLVREFLRDVRSELLHETDAARIYELMRLTKPINSHRAPRNVALLMFSDDPERWFRGARIELAQFRDEAGGNVIEEQVFRGPLHHQIRQCLSYLQNLTMQHTEKVADHSATRGWVSYPSLALREALINALYHRDYHGVLEPTKVYLYPDRIEIISYPGPVHGIELEHLQHGARIPKVPARNRRIGELLKELRLAEARGTGIAKIYRTMQENGSPEPQFEFDSTRTYFSVTLPAHREYVALAALREYAYHTALGDDRRALSGLETAHQARPRSGVIGAKLVAIYGERGDLPRARVLAESFSSAGGQEEVRVMIALTDVYVAHKRPDEAKKVLDSLRLIDGSSFFRVAILEKRLGRLKKAHRYFDHAGEIVLNDVRALHEFAQVKMKLADIPRNQRHLKARKDARVRILREAHELLERVLQMDAPTTRHAWAWFDLSRVLRWLRLPLSEQIEALKKANELVPSEHRFQEALRRAIGEGSEGQR